MDYPYIINSKRSLESKHDKIKQRFIAEAKAKKEKEAFWAGFVAGGKWFFAGIILGVIISVVIF
jgi:hypothetical protein